MGPRSLDRGNKCKVALGKLTMIVGLQWGRDLSIAEIHLEPRKGGRGRLSSMGPRSLDRGNGEKACVFCR